MRLWRECKKCGYAIDWFDLANINGYLCRDCYIPINREKARNYYKTKYGKSRVRKAILKSSKKYPEKVRARSYVHWALRTGKLIKGKCQVCDSIKVQAHHHDYSKPLQVSWLCTVHHGLIHRKVVDL